MILIDLVSIPEASVAGTWRLELQSYVQANPVQFLQKCVSLRHRTLVCSIFGMVSTENKLCLV